MIRCRRFLRRTRAGLRFDKRALEKMVSFEIVAAPVVMNAALEVVSYLDDTQYYYCREMNRARRLKNPELYREMERGRDGAVRALADMLSQPHPRALGRWALKNFQKVVHLVTPEVQEEVAREMEKFYIFPILKS